jgi:mono/diheme cytochrome c family protein
LRLQLGAFACLIALAAAGCGTGGLPENADESRGKDLFLSGVEGKPSCASCHALADAPARGTVGPNLDEAFAGPREQGFKESTIAAIVLDQIRYPTEGSAMPADLVKGDDAEAVAAYVASVAGKEVEGRPAGGTGEALFTQLGCQGCHSLEGARGTGPPLNGIAGKPRRLANGKTAVANDAYLLEAIRDPDAKIVQGYQPGVMTAVVRPNQVSEPDARKLVQFIKSRR